MVFGRIRFLSFFVFLAALYNQGRRHKLRYRTATDATTTLLLLPEYSQKTTAELPSGPFSNFSTSPARAAVSLSSDPYISCSTT